MAVRAERFSHGKEGAFARNVHIGEAALSGCCTHLPKGALAQRVDEGEPAALQLTRDAPIQSLGFIELAALAHGVELLEEVQGHH